MTPTEHEPPFGLSSQELSDAYTQAANRPAGMPRHVAYLHIVEARLAERKMASTAGLMPLVRQYENTRVAFQNLALVTVPLVLEAERAGVEQGIVGAAQSELQTFYARFYRAGEDGDA